MYGMKPDEMRRAAALFTREIARLTGRPVRLMEVCGTHTVAIFKAGIRSMLPAQIELVSGPGCPVCVTPNRYIDTAVAYSRQDDVIIATFGDMLKVPGSSSSLMEEKARGADIRIVYSPLDSLAIARQHPDKTVVFLAVGFETTAPTAAATLLQAETAGLANFYMLTAHKTAPPAIRALLTSPATQVDGFLLPGHVSSIIGLEPYRFLSEEFHVPAVVAGFEPLDILQSVYMLVRQIAAGEARVENQYKRAVPAGGNKAALAVMDKVYEPADTVWRGLGTIPMSGLILRGPYCRFDAAAALAAEVEKEVVPPGCRCGEVLCGVIRPAGCRLFGTACTPEHPVGACMVSVEGTCAAWYKYGAGRWQP